MSIQTASCWRCFDSAVVGKWEALGRKHTWGFCLWIPSQASDVRTTLTGDAGHSPGADNRSAPVRPVCFSVGYSVNYRRHSIRSHHTGPVLEATVSAPSAFKEGQAEL